MRLPSGEIAGGAATAPSLPRQSSVAAPSLNFHSPSAPPLEDRYRSQPRPKRGDAARTAGTERRLAAPSSTTWSVIGTVQRWDVGFATVAARRRPSAAATERYSSRPKLTA